MKTDGVDTKQIIITTGYMGSGSSAITDLLTEFDGVNTCNNDFEYIFMHCPNGVFDLEDKLLRGNNALRSDEAIRQFRMEMQKLFSLKNYWPGLYERCVSKEFINIVDRYIASIVQMKIEGAYWYYTEIPDTVRLQLSHFINKVLRKLSFGKLHTKKILKYPDMYISIPMEKEFFDATKLFLQEFFDLFVGNRVVLDQFILPHNLYRYDNYFDTAKVIVVERDPRDVFYSNKYVWMPQQCGIPYATDVSLFCEHYKRMRKNEKVVSNPNILRIHFEDLVYCYDETLKQIEIHLGLEDVDHIRKRTKFNPDISINNIGLYQKYDKYSDEFMYMTEYLKEYLYNFDDKSVVKNDTDKKLIF